MTPAAPDVVVFPGQGSQRPGMGADLHRSFALARDTFAEASDAAGVDLARMCFGDDPSLGLTEFTQPCILTVEIAFHRVAVAEHGLAAGLFGGHSLGEYSALVAAGVLALPDAVRLVRARGAAMQQAVPAGQGAMAALILDDIEAAGVLGLAETGGVEIANYNSPSQVVISGLTDRLGALRRRLAEEFPELTFVPLRVSAPFHSSLMRPAAEEFRHRVDAVRSRMEIPLSRRVTSNVTGGFHEPASLVENLVRQVSAPVRWRHNMQALVAARGGRIFEIGPSAALTKFFRALDVPVHPVVRVADLAVTAQHAAPVHLGPAAVRPAVAATATAHLAPAVRPHAPTPAPAQAPAAVPVPVPGPGVVPIPPSVVDQQPVQLGSARFRAEHGTRLAYVAGGLPMGGATPELVSRLSAAGALAYLSTDGLTRKEIEGDVRQLRSTVPGAWGVSVCATPYQPELSAGTIDLCRREGVTRVEATGFADVTAELVRYRLAGLRTGADGRVAVAHRLLVRVPGPEVARRFLLPAPEALLRPLVDAGTVTEAEAALSQRIAMADDVCFEVAEPARIDLLSGLATLTGLRDRMVRQGTCPSPVRIGAAGGLGTPASLAAAFLAGADFVLASTINQATVEAALSDRAKDMLAAAGVGDFTSAPSAELFEIGGRVAVLRKGVFFPARADRLHELYLRHDSVADLPTEVRTRLEREFLGRGVDEVWTDVQADPLLGAGSAMREAAGHPRRRFALIVRWYLVNSLRRAAAGDGDRLNWQIRADSALGALNEALDGTPLRDWRNRHVADLAWFMMRGAAEIVDGRRPPAR